MQADARQLFCLKAILNSFASSTGLVVNFSKSLLVPINVSNEKMKVLAGNLGCQIGSLPFTYLGLPLGTTKPKIDEFAPLLNRIKRKLSACSTLLSYSGRVECINTVLTPTVNYAMCTLKLHKCVIEGVDRMRKQCLSRGNLARKKGGNLAAWSLVQRPKQKGGLGIKNLYLQNDALLIKQLHKFYSKEGIPWVQQIWFKYNANRVPHAQRLVGSFWWKDVFRLKDLYGSITTCQLGDGSSILFWKDNWAGEWLADLFPNIALYAKHLDLSVMEVLEATCLEDLFDIPISQQVVVELEDLRSLIEDFDLSSGLDQRIFCWKKSNYAAAKLYKLAFSECADAGTILSGLETTVTPRVKFFAWLILLDRLNTKNMLARRNFNVNTKNIFARRNFNVQTDNTCVLCDDGMGETIDHLFFEWSFVWEKININWVNDIDIHRRIERSR